MKTKCQLCKREVEEFSRDHNPLRLKSDEHDLVWDTCTACASKIANALIKMIKDEGLQ